MSRQLNVGDVVGKLTIISIAGQTYTCRCVCDAECTRTAISLLSAHSAAKCKACVRAKANDRRRAARLEAVRTKGREKRRAADATRRAERRQPITCAACDTRKLLHLFPVHTSPPHVCLDCQLAARKPPPEPPKAPTFSPGDRRCDGCAGNQYRMAPGVSCRSCGLVGVEEPLRRDAVLSSSLMSSCGSNGL